MNASNKFPTLAYPSASRFLEAAVRTLRMLVDIAEGAQAGTTGVTITDRDACPRAACNTAGTGILSLSSSDPRKTTSYEPPQADIERSGDEKRLVEPRRRAYIWHYAEENFSGKAAPFGVVLAGRCLTRFVACSLPARAEQVNTKRITPRVTKGRLWL